MARLPTLDDLGRRAAPQSDRGKPAVVPNAGAIADAAGDIGNVVLKVGAQALEEQDRLDYGLAKSALITADLTARQKYQDDPDYGTIETRYQSDMKSAAEAAGRLIKTRSGRSAFDADVQMNVARGSAEVAALATGKRKSAQIGAGNEALAANMQGAIQADDEEVRNGAIAASRDIVQGLLHGGAIQADDAERIGRTWTQDLRAGRVDWLLAKDKISEAAKEYDLYKGMMKPDDAIRLQGALTLKDRDQTAKSIAGLTRSWTEGGDPKAAGGTGLLAAMLPITLQSESGNRDFDKDGTWLTSSAGAKGRMQVMPGTSRDPGFGVRPATNDDPDELARVGRDYLGKMLERYKDPAKAWAAYNAGPGAVDNALKEGGDWLSHLPKETQGYVASNVKKLGGISAPGGAAGASLRDRIEYADAALLAVRPDASPDMRDAVRSEVQKDYTLERAEITEQQDHTEADFTIRASRGDLSVTEVETAAARGAIGQDARARLVVDIEKEQKKRDELAAIVDKIDRGQYLDGKDDKTKKAVDADYLARRERFFTQPRSSDEALQFVAGYVNRVGFVPPTVETRIRLQLRNPDPVEQVGAAKVLRAITSRNPAMMKDFSEEDISRGQQIIDYTEMGLEPAEAARRADEDTRIPKAAQQERGSQYETLFAAGKNKGLTASAVVAKAFDVDVSGLDEQSAGGALLRADFERLRKQEFIRTGNLSTSTATAMQLLKRQWGVSYVNGKEQVTKYPPETFYSRYGDPKMDAKWIREQAADELLAGGMSGPDAADRLRIRPHPTKPPTNGNPIYVGVLLQPNGTEEVLIDSRGRPREWIPTFETSKQAERDKRRIRDGVTAARAARGMSFGDAPVMPSMRNAK